MSMFRILCICTLAGTAVLSTPAAAQAFLDQQPTQLDSLVTHDAFRSHADNFTLSSQTDLSTITWWGNWEANLTTADTFNIYVHIDDPFGLFGVAPGAVIASYLGVAPTLTPTGNSFPAAAGTLDEFQLQVTLPTPLTLNAGTYWIELYCTGSAGSGDFFVWEMAPEDPVGGSPCMAWSIDTPGVTWFPCTPFNETDMALRLESPAFGPQLSVSNLNAGGLATIQVDSATPNSGVPHALSLNGGGPTVTPFGTLLLTAPYIVLPSLVTDAVGTGALSLNVPAGTSGTTVWFHAYDQVSGLFTNGVMQTVL
ncbi:MAG: DUF7901 domain-containing protein [Planctomycetota bacterium]|jgi:hypothetical protein